MTTTILEPTVTADPFAHQTYVDPCPGMKGEETVVETCGKCSGSGTVSWGVDVDGVVVENGRQRIVPKVCFDCNGTGRYVRKVKNIRAAERRRVKAYNDAMDAQREYIAKAAVREAEEAARLAAFRTEHADLAADLDVVGNGFAESLTEQIKTGKSLSERQVEVLRSMAADKRSQAGRTWLGEEGEQVTFEGKIVDVKVFDGYAYGTSSYLFIIQTTDGNKVTVYTSAQFMFDLRDSEQVAKFTATVKAQKEYQGAKETQVARIKKVK